MVKLSKDGWHYKLQEFVLGSATHRMNLCPYFWITVFCMLASPFIAIYKGVVVMAEGSITFIDKVFCIPLNLYLISNVSDSRLADMWKAALIRDEDDYFTFNTRLSLDFDLWRKDREARGIDWKAELNERIKKFKQSQPQKSQEIKKLAAKKRKAAIDNVMIKTAKSSFIILILSAVGFFGWLSWRTYVVIMMHWEKFIEVIIALAMAIPIVAILGLVVYVFICLIKKCSLSVSFPESKLLSNIWNGIKSFFSFFWEYSKTWKEDHCPGIHWE